MSQKRKSTSAPDNRIAKRPTPEPSYDDPQPLQASTSSFQVSQNYFTNSQTQSHVNIPHDRYDRSAPPPEPSWIMPTSGPSGNSRNYIQRRLPVPKRTTASTAPSLSDPWLHTLVSSPQVPQVYGSQARQAYGSIRHDQEEEPTGSYHGLSRVAPTLHSSGDPRDSHSQQDIGGKFPHLNSIYRSRTPLSERSVSTISAQSFHDDLAMSPFPPSSPGSIETPRVTPSIYTLQDNNTRFRPQLEHRGTEFVSPPLSEPLLPSPTGPTGSRKKSVFGATRILLQTAASALKMSPVPALLANIPDLLLTLLQVFETVDGNRETLSELNEEVQKAYNTILRPLQLWTGQISPEVDSLIKEFHRVLEDQNGQIRSLKSQGLVKRIVSGTQISRSISDVKACINKAVSSFSTEATTLALLHTIQIAIQSDLARLARVPAEYTYVKTKFECLPTTRIRMQRSILKHLGKARTRFVWLRGSPGTGKTAISMSIASTLHKQHSLAASFFWDKNQKGTGLDSLERFPSTLARQLAHWNEDFKVLLVKRLRNPDLELVQSLPLETQMKVLITEPMNDLMGIWASREGRIVIVLDGLDECGDPGALQSLMKLVLLLDELPPIFSVLVSCRPEQEVVSAWNRAKARDGSLEIPCEDVDKTEEDETLYTVRCMVDEGLRDCIRESAWEPSEEDLEVFTSGCRGLPVMASIRVREVCARTQMGSSLRQEFDYFRDLTEVPNDLNSEYLRILQRGYVSHFSRVRPCVANNYRQVVGMIIAAQSDYILKIESMSILLGITENDIDATLKPISSIVKLPSDNTEPVTFYHATAKEFITGEPIGEESDRVFFISDVEGYFLGLRLLRLVNGTLDRNEFNIPTELPLGDKKKWTNWHKKQLESVDYAFEWLAEHLDPSLLFSRESNELQREFNQFLTKHLLSFTHVGSFSGPSWDRFKGHELMQLWEARWDLRWGADGIDEYNDYDVYRSCLPFTPSSSPIYKLYGHLTDPIRVFSIDGEFGGHVIPLSQDALNALKITEVELNELPKKVDRGDPDVVIDYEAEFCDHNVHNGIVTCATLSPDGHFIALGFGSGAIEIANIDHQCTISQFQCNPPSHLVWIKFCNGNHWIATEDSGGNIVIFGDDIQPLRLGTLPSDLCPPVAAVSDSGSMVLRAPGELHEGCNDITLLYISCDPSIQLLAWPPLEFPETPTPSLGFSPGGRYVAVHFSHNIFVWSTDSCKLITRYRFPDSVRWVLSAGVVPTSSYVTPELVHPKLATSSISEKNPGFVQNSQRDLGQNTDESWMESPFYGFEAASLSEIIEHLSSTVGRVPIIDKFNIWFNGGDELVLPQEYRPAYYSNGAWYGDRVLNSDYPYFPPASKDGTRFIVQGKMTAPIIIDISQVV